MNWFRGLRRRWKVLLGLALVLLLAAGAGAIYLVNALNPDDVYNPDVEFEQEKPRKKKTKREIVRWPTYGLNARRTRYLDAPLRPPFRPAWKLPGAKLIELAPTTAQGMVFTLNIDGIVSAIDADTGKRLWRRRVGRLAASSPTWSNGRLFITTLRPGRIVSLRAKSGRVHWSKRLPARSESSPLVVGGRIFFGSGNGTVYGLRRRDGTQVWKFNAGADVESALAYENGKLYFGNYEGEVFAIRVRNGKQVWKSSGISRGPAGAGIFYSTPAVAYGRVYIGNNDGRMYSFSAKTGKLGWSQQTGGSELYAGPAVATVPKLGPTVFAGAYNERFYAFDARTGRVRWQFKARGRINGAASIIGDIVYFADIDSRTTYGLDVSTGRRRWSFHAGTFSPVISDGKRIYLTGYGSQYAFEPAKRRRRR